MTASAVSFVLAPSTKLPVTGVTSSLTPVMVGAFGAVVSASKSIANESL